MLKKLVFLFVLFANMLFFCHAVTKEIVTVENLITITCAGENYIGQIGNQCFVKPGTELIIQYRLLSEFSGGSNSQAQSGGYGGCYDTLYINDDIYGFTTTGSTGTNNASTNYTVNKDTDISIYHTITSGGKIDQETCLFGIVIRCSGKFSVKYSSYNDGPKNVTIPKDEYYDFEFSIKNSENEKLWCIKDSKVYIKKGAKLENIKWDFNSVYKQYQQNMSKSFSYSAVFDGKSLSELKTFLEIRSTLGFGFDYDVTNDFDLVIYDPSSNEILRQTFYADSVNPSITLTPEPTADNWNNSFVTVSASDMESGLQSLEIKTDKDEVISSGTGESVITNDGIYTVTATDGAGNMFSKTVSIDTVFPSIKLKGIELTDTQNNSWYTDNDLKLEAYDSLSLIKSFEVNGQNVKNPHTISNNGEYKILAEDKAGNKTERTIKVDNKKPVIANKSIKYEKDGRLIQSISLSATAEEKDYNSGLDQLCIKEGDISKAPGELQSDAKSGRVEATINNLDRSRLSKFDFKVYAKDIAGNEIDSAWDTIYLPPEIILSVNNKYIENSETVTELLFNNFSGNELYYDSINIRRIIYIDGNELTEENFTQYFEENARNNWHEIIREKEIKKEEIVNGVYKDRFNTLLGFGHKETGYIINWEPHGTGITEYSKEIKTVTADSKGLIRIKINGRNDEGEISFTSGQFIQEGKELQLAADGSINIGIQIEDDDYEPYQVELRQKVNDGNNGEILSLLKPGFILNGISGKARYEGFEEQFESGKWNWFSKPEYLSYNRECCLYLRIKAGYSGKESKCESADIYLKAEPVDLGGFVLKVCSSADYNWKGITARPFQEIELELDGDIGNVSWDFGDGSNSAQGKSVLHKWGQKESRQGDTSEFELQITVVGKSTVNIPVIIVDTKVGELFGNEVWYGRHEILGKITIPEGKELTIGKQSNSEDIEILCIGDDEKNYMGCLEIKQRGKLSINNGDSRVSLYSAVNTKKGIEKEERIEGRTFLYWNGIVVNNEAEAVLKGIEISGSERGIAVDSDGKLNVRDSSILHNKTGFHVFGECQIKSSEISNNEEYGIKEEDGCRLQVVQTSLSNNTIDWYDDAEGPLSEREISERAGE